MSVSSSHPGAEGGLVAAEWPQTQLFKGQYRSPVIPNSS